MMNRRTLFGLLFTPASLLRGTMPSSTVRRTYRVNASILFLGITIFSKQNVGGGYASVEESVEGGLNRVRLQFAGGSWPNSAHGVNRLGFIEESVVERAYGDPADAAYFGFMTSSAEKSFDDAKKALNAQAGSTVPYAATRGWANGGKFSCNVFRLQLPARLTFADCRELTQQVKAAAIGEPFEKREIETGGVPHTFLNSIRRALLNPARNSDSELVYNGKQYRMTIAKQPDGTSIRLNGTLQERGSEHRTPFQLWFAKDGKNFLPTRIEYRAKSFLKLVFEEHA